MGEVEVINSPEVILHDIKPQIAALGDYSIRSIVEVIPFETAQEIDRIQQADFIKNGAPTDDWITSLGIPSTIEYLTENKETYDEAESLLDEDSIYQRLLETRDHYKSSEDYSKLVRLRRTIALRLILEELKIFGVDAVPQKAPTDNVA